MTELAFRSVAVHDDGCVRREHRSDLAEMLFETGGGQAERVSNVSSRVIFWLPRIEEKRRAGTPQLLGLIERQEFFGLDRLFRRRDIRNAARGNLVRQKPKPGSQRDD